MRILTVYSKSDFNKIARGNNMVGKIVKAISGFYYVEFENEIYECRAKGILKKNNISPMVGDNAEFEKIGKDKGNLITVTDRKNALIRPPVANIDKVIIVVAVKNPEPSLLFIDKQLVFLEKLKIPVTICVNKIDIVKAEDIKRIYENIGYDVIFTSVKEKYGMKELKENIKGNTVAFVGNSGVGKSSLTNRLMDEVIMEEGDLSKIERGKQTTRHSQLLKLEENTYIIDTPGFSSFDLDNVDLNELALLFREFNNYIPSCRYRDCRHILEEECGIRKAVDSGDVATERFENFKVIYDEISKRRK